MKDLAITWLIRLGLAAAFLGVGAYFGYQYADNACQAGKGAAQTVAIEQHDLAADAGKKAERKSATRAAKTEAVFNGISQGVITYAQKHPAAFCSLDADGLRLWAAANANADPEPAAERDAAMPDAADPAERAAAGPAGQPRSDGQGVSPVQGSAPGAGAVAGGD